MKTINRIIYSIIGLFIIVSCNSDDQESVPYYQLNEQDKNLIINYNYQKDQIITYENEDGEHLNFKVVSNSEEKYGKYAPGGFGGGSSLLHHYDSRIIRFEILENQDYEEFGIVNYVFSKNNDVLTNGINFPLWNVFNSSIIDESQNPINIFMNEFNNSNKMQMNINNHSFERVVVIESGSNELFLNSSYGTLPLNVNKVYYDYDFGIIRFDDIDGKEWEVIYPE
ncbi:hypothetical protein [Cochleicola gelatinilyticus]|uniref:Uncharacterized protein n=1 Tax=Cochleicola gelatinilyticus TaxID=1763537 RepID=A0A167J7F7_9FLAO|nr:hypothetical protein [Cochleicola gelatinilyticus]OAB80396.1 hypothetical protein ULVI_06585 [Cochleicola gelatinilyticus]